jgi:hypothetical protein
MLGASQGIGAVASTALAPDGSVFLLDYSLSRIVKFDADGNILWKAGGQGSDPGQFTQAYRVAARHDGGALVVDIATRRVVAFDRKGTFEREHFIEPSMSQVDDIVELPSGEIAISGVVRDKGPTGALPPPRAVTSGVHVFSARMEYLKSFGALPYAKNPQVLRFWGAGALALTDGGLLYTRKLPYEIYRYTASGMMSLRVAVTPAVTAMPDEFMTIGPSAPDALGTVGVRYQLTSKDVPRPARAALLDSAHIISGLLSEKRRLIDIIDIASGAVVASSKMPPGWDSIIGLDRKRSVLWALAEVDNLTVLVRQTIAYPIAQP